MEKTNAIRVRMAPSPTGTLHVGTARTTLFNYLFARNQGATFVMRIEDTDAQRSSKEFEENILNGLTWLGIDWDEGPLPGGGERGEYGPYRQSERGATYRMHLEKMLAEGTAFYCWHTQDELQVEGAEQTKRKEAPRHVCAHKDEQDEHSAERVGAIIRFANRQQGTISFTDAIKGEISFDAALLGDFSIAKNLDAALYNFAVVVDDYEMKISHVIRGEDHISNTPKQLLLYAALGFEAPRYAHLPLLLGADRSKLSKRHGATSVDEYRSLGYVPEAMFNFLALLGWRQSDERELLTKEDIVSAFSLEDVQTSPAIFDIEKLNWMNGEYLRATSRAEFARLAKPFMEEAGLPTDDARYEDIVCLEQQRVRKLAEVPEAVRFAFEVPSYEADMLRWKDMPMSDVIGNLQGVLGIMEKTPEGEWSQESLEGSLMSFAEGTGNRGMVLWPLRVSLSGQQHSPGPFEIMAALGKEESIRRVKAAIELASS